MGEVLTVLLCAALSVVLGIGLAALVTRIWWGKSSGVNWREDLSDE